MGRPLDGDLALLHRLEERRLRPRRRPVDLVDEEDVREDRPGTKRRPLPSKMLEPVTSVGQQVGRALDPAVRRSSARATARASRVLPVPGTSSTSTWPSASSARVTRRSGSSAPTTAGRPAGAGRPRGAGRRRRRQEAARPDRRSRRARPPCPPPSGLAREAAQDRRQDAALAVVVDVDRPVEPGDRLEPPLRAPFVARRRPSGAGAGSARRRGPRIVYDSRPVRPSDAALSPGRNWSGSTPIPTRFERWIRS